MATIRPNQLPASAGVAASDVVIVDTGSAVNKATPEQIIDAAAPKASQTDAEAGTDNTKRMTALRTKQAIDALGVTAAALLSDDGSDKVAYKRVGAFGGANTTNILIQDKLEETIHSADYSGIDPTGNTESTAGMQAMLRDMQKSGKKGRVAGNILTDTLHIDPVGDPAYEGYGQIWLEGEVSGSYGTNLKTGGTRITHVNGSAAPLIQGVGTSTGNSIRELTIANLLLVSGNNTTDMVKLNLATEMLTFFNVFLRQLNPTGNGYNFNRIYGLNIIGGRAFGPASVNPANPVASGTGLIIESVDPSNALTTNMCQIIGLDVYRFGCGKRFGGLTTTNTGIVGPVAVIGGQSSNCDEVGVLIGADARNISLINHHAESCIEAGVAITNQARMTRLENCSYKGNGLNGTSADVEIGYNGYNSGDIRGAIGVKIIDASHYDTARSYRLFPGGNLRNIEFSGVLDCVPTDASEPCILIDDNAIGTSPSNFVSMPVPERFIRENGGTSFASLVDDTRGIASYRHDELLEVTFASGTTQSVGLASSALFNYSSPTPVTSIGPGMFNGQSVQLKFANGNVTLQNGSNMNLAGGANYTGSANSSIVLDWDEGSSKWVERRR